MSAFMILLENPVADFFSARNRYAFCRLFAVTVATSIRGWKHGGLLNFQQMQKYSLAVVRSQIV